MQQDIQKEKKKSYAASFSGAEHIWNWQVFL